MSTFHATHPGNASNPSTWTEHSVPSSIDDWITTVEIFIDSGLPSGSSGGPQLDAGGKIEVQSCNAIINADVRLTVNSGATIQIDSALEMLDLLGVLIIDGGTFANFGLFQSTDRSAATLVAYHNALLINPTNFAFGRWMPQSMDDGSGGPTTVRLQYTEWGAAAGSYVPGGTILATVANGATLDFVTRDSSGAVTDPDFLPTVPVIRQGAATDTIVTLRCNSPGSYTATFPTPIGDESYYVPVSWQAGGSTFVQEFRVAVLNPDLPGRVLGGGTSVFVGDGVKVTDAEIAASGALWGGVAQKLLVGGLTGAGARNGIYPLDPTVWTTSGFSGEQLPSWGDGNAYGIVSDGTYWYLFTNSLGGSPVWKSSVLRVGGYNRAPWDASLVWTQTQGAGNGLPSITRADVDGVSMDRAMRAVLALAAGTSSVATAGGNTTVTFFAQDGTTPAFTVTFAAATGQRISTSIGA